MCVIFNFIYIQMRNDYDKSQINESPIDSWLWFHLWLENWNTMYWGLICMGISFLNFQLYNIILLSYPAFFTSLCAAIGVTHFLLIFAVACTAIIGSGMLIGTFSYSLFLLHYSFNQIDKENMDLIKMWSVNDAEYPLIIKLLNDPPFCKLSQQLQHFHLSNKIKHEILSDHNIRQELIKLLEKLPSSNDQNQTIKPFLKNICMILENIANHSDSQKVKITVILESITFLLDIKNPPYETLSEVALNFTDNIVEIYQQLKIYKHTLNPELIWEIVAECQLEEQPLRNLIKEANRYYLTIEEAAKNLNTIWIIIAQSSHSPSISAEKRAYSPTLQQHHDFKIKREILRELWPALHCKPNELLSIWSLIAKNPQFERIIPLIKAEFKNQNNDKFIHNLIQITKIGYSNFPIVDRGNLSLIYEDQEMMKTFLLILNRLFLHDAFLPDFFNFLIKNATNLPSILEYIDANPTKTKERLFCLIEKDNHISNDTFQSSDTLDETSNKSTDVKFCSINPPSIAPISNRYSFLSPIGEGPDSNDNSPNQFDLSPYRR